MDKTKIEWCDATWNPVTGCLHGCEYCYARGIARRFAGHWNEEKLRSFGADGGIHRLESPTYRHTTGKNRSVPVHNVQAAYPFGFDPTFHRYRLDKFKEKSGRTIFVCSMADLFGKWVPDEWIQEVFKACNEAPQHRYLFLTKNPKRYTQLMINDKLHLGENIWYGTTVTDNKSLKKGEELYSLSPFKTNTFMSIEPLLGEVNLGIMPDWVIIGAETGIQKAKITPDRIWVQNIVNACRCANVPVFMKNSLLPIWGEPLIQEFPWGV